MVITITNTTSTGKDINMSKKGSIRYRENHGLDFRKYEMTEEFITYKGRVLTRIRALKDLPKHGVKKGDLGGFIESSWNLTHKGSCWVADNAKVFEKGAVRGDSLVCGNATIRARAIVMGNAVVQDNALITSNANIKNNSIIKDNAMVLGFAQVGGNAIVSDRAKVCADSMVYGGMPINGDMVIAVEDKTLKHHDRRREKRAYFKKKYGVEKAEREREVFY